MISFSAHVASAERVQQRLRKVTQALDAAEIPYAVVGGNAVAAWVGRVDPAATRATKDVDLLVQRRDVDSITATLAKIGLRREDLRDLVRFVDPAEPSRRSGVHLVWAGERIRPSYIVPWPLVTEAERDPEGFMVLSLAALVRMKLTSFRDIDRAHVRDMLEVGLIDARIEGLLPAELGARLEEVRRSE